MLLSDCAKYMLLFCVLLNLCLCSSNAELSKITCQGDVKKFQNYVRLVYDTDSEDDFNQDTFCMFLLEKQLNEKRNYNLQFGIRMSDTIKHDEYDDDYLTVDTGMANITLKPTELRVTTTSNEESCKAQVFEHESGKDFSHKNIFNTRVEFDNNKVNVLYATNDQRKWTHCATVFMSTYTKRHIHLYAHSEFGINIDIINMDVDAQHAPWISKRIIDNIKSPQHALEHQNELTKLQNNITKKEFSRLGRSVQWLWYYQVFVTAAILAISLKYKFDRRRKMHLL